MTPESEHEPVWVDRAISALLRGGVLLSIAVVVAGMAFTFLHHPDYVSSGGTLGSLTDAGRVYPHTLSGVAGQVAARRGQAIAMLGLLLLIVTPVARVAFSIVAFALERDLLYTIITAVVLALLLLSFAIGAGG